MLKLLCDGNVAKMQQLWLRKQRVVSSSRQQAEGQSRPMQQGRATRPAREPAAQAKRQTPAQAARKARSQMQLRRKHLASKLWACVRVAARLQAWRVRATLRGVPPPAHQPGHRPSADGPARFDADGRFWSVCGGYRRVEQHRLTRKVLPEIFSVARPEVVATGAAASTASYGGTALMHHMQSTISPASAQRQPAAPQLPAPPPASQLAAPPPAPPGRQMLDSEQLAAAARATLDDSELQDHRGSKRDASARTPPPKSNPRHPSLAKQPQPPPPPGPKRSRGGAACNAALAAAAPLPAAAAAAPRQPCTASTYAAAALAAANPHHISA